MKKLFISALLFLILGAQATFAVTPTTTPTPSKTDLEEKAQKLLDLVASDAAKLNLTEKRGTLGTVTDITSTQITLDDVNGNRRFVDVDELTKFSNPAAKGTFGISDIEKGQVLGVLGLYNKSSRRILARFIDVTTLPNYIHGAVLSVDNKNFNFDVFTDKSKQLNIDVETVTKTFNYTASDGLSKAGFSKVTENENVIVVGYPDKTVANKIISSIIILLPETASNPAITLPGTGAAGQLLPTGTTVPSSTGSGKTLTPKTY